MKKVFKILGFVFCVGLVLSVSFLCYFFAVTSHLTLDENKLKKPFQKHEIYFANGEKFEYDCQYEYVSLDKMPKELTSCVVAIEDKRFYSHGGIDFKSILRAIKNNLSSGKIKEGGSTISQQLVKNVYLSGEKTLVRKLKEIRLTTQLEKKYGKDEILEKYLNTVYFGENAYGVQNASKKFFGKDVTNLTLEECATLTACLKAPSYYNPIKNPQKSLERRNLILKQLYSQNIIDKNSYLQAKSTDITVNFSKDYERENKLYSEILDSALSLLNLDDASSINGFKIYTNLDKRLIDNLPKLTDYGINYDYSVIVTDNKNSSVIGYYSTVGEVKRLPASTCKPWLIYAPAIEENLISPATLILDEKTNFDGYTPSNYNEKYYGYISVEDALSKSLNVPSIKICNLLGTDKVKNYAKKMGVTFENNDLSIALGNLTGGMTLKNLSDAYSVFSNGGEFKKSSFITEILNERNKTVYQNNNFPTRVFGEDTCFLINTMLNECSKSGTANKLSSLPFSVYAKTGTNGTKGGNYDAYCVAYTSEHTVAVWVGDGNGRIMPNSISGGNYPTALCRDVLNYIYKTHLPKEFTPPKSVSLIDIDKQSYEKDFKIFKANEHSAKTLKFWFKNDIANSLKRLERQISPLVKDCKISCNYRDIEIYFETENCDGVEILDGSQTFLFEVNKDGKFTFSVSKDGKYDFYLQPFLIENGEKFYGEKIKLPTVIAEGKKDILDKPWWEE